MGTLDKLGIAYDQARRCNPGIIYCSVSGFGQTGPYRDRAALDLIVQAESGMMNITGEPGSRGVRNGVSIADTEAALADACAGPSTPSVPGNPTRRVLPLLAAVVTLFAGCLSLRPDPAHLAALEPDLGLLLLVGFTGTEGPGNTELERLLCEARVGGVLLFGRNVVDAAQVAALTGWVRERARACAGRPVLVATDAEGGQVMRLGPRAGYAATLSHRELGDANDFTLTELEARRIGRMLREAGITWNLAPVVDVGYNPANPAIVGTGRSFSAHPSLVTAHARAYISGMRAEGVITALKHFPGHGSSYGDTHGGFVDVTETANRDLELGPYHALIAEHMVDSIMTAHVINRWLDQRHPATLSRPTITGLLRRDLGWDGVVVTDDLGMGAIVQGYGLDTAAVLALGAGVDVLLLAEDRLPDGRSTAAIALSAIRTALLDGRLDPARLAASIARVRALAASD